MIIVTAFMSVLFVCMAFFINEKNSEYLLSGYNTLSKAEREQFDITGYLKVFKRFHLILGATLLPGTLLIQLINEAAASIFMIMYVLLGYFYFLLRTRSYSAHVKNQKTLVYGSLAVMMISIIGVSYLFIVGFKESDLTIQHDSVAISGLYGLEIKRSDLRDAEVVEELPPISIKTNGFAAGGYSKGNFKTKDGRHVKLFINRNARPYLWIKTSTQDIYYSSSETTSEELSRAILQWKKQGADSH